MPMKQKQPWILLVTVGTTKHQKLVDAVTDSKFLDYIFLHLKNHPPPSKVIIQYGTSSPKSLANVQCSSSSQIELHPFINDLPIAMCHYENDHQLIVISHCGSGTILDVLRGPPEICNTTPIQSRRLILVPNDTLKDAHQDELAQAIKSMPSSPATIVNANSSTDALVDGLCQALEDLPLNSHHCHLPPVSSSALNSIISNILES